MRAASCECEWWGFPTVANANADANAYPTNIHRYSRTRAASNMYGRLLPLRDQVAHCVAHDLPRSLDGGKSGAQAQGHVSVSM